MLVVRKRVELGQGWRTKRWSRDSRRGSLELEDWKAGLLVKCLRCGRRDADGCHTSRLGAIIVFCRLMMILSCRDGVLCHYSLGEKRSSGCADHILSKDGLSGVWRESWRTW